MVSLTVSYLRAQNLSTFATLVWINLGIVMDGLVYRFRSAFSTNIKRCRMKSFWSESLQITYFDVRWKRLFRFVTLLPQFTNSARRWTEEATCHLSSVPWVHSTHHRLTMAQASTTNQKRIQPHKGTERTMALIAGAKRKVKQSLAAT